MYPPETEHAFLLLSACSGGSVWTEGPFESVKAKAAEEERASKVYGEDFGKTLLAGDDYAAMNEWAWFWALKEKYLQTALLVAQTAVEGDPTGNKWDTLSMVYWKLSRYEEAIEAEEEGMRLDPGNRAKYEARIEEIRADMRR